MLPNIDVMGNGGFFESMERLLSRLRLIWWFVVTVVGLLAFIVSGWWAHAFGFPWQLVALTAIGGLTATALVMGCLFWFSTLVWRRIRVASILKKLDQDARFLMAVEGVALKRTFFGPYLSGDGEYGYMSWDRVRTVALRLIDLGILEVSSQPNTKGQYKWTPLGRALLEKIPESDSELPR
jgi:hypothetical protein